jgi:hypothetical protein
MIVQTSIQFVLQILLPGLFLSELLRRRYPGKREWLVRVGVFGLVLLFVFLTARWDWFSYYLRLMVPGLFIGVSYISYRRAGSESPSTSDSIPWGGYLSTGILIVGLVGLNIGVLKGYFYPGEAVKLSYPLKGGVYYVGGGGNSRWINNQSAFPPQEYALDIVRLNALGNRALGLWPTDLDRYTIYGDPIYSPCAGRVVSAADEFPDRSPPAQDNENPAGNYVLIACHEVEVLLAHMMRGSVTVEEGDRVNEGAVVGRVGNSGNTTQPHLHIHVERGGTPGEMLNGRGVPATFGGRFLVRNSLFTGK